MPRRPRITLSHVPLHLVQRGNNRQTCFFTDKDRLAYLRWLEEYAGETDCSIHAYVLMSNHVHLLLTPSTPRAAGTMMKRLGQRFVQYINRSYGRSGTLWEGRFRSCIVQEDHHLLCCHRYIELNPVRAGMVSEPSQYPWSSFRINAHGGASSLVTPHPVYTAMGADARTRRAAYRELFREHLGDETIDQIRGATNGNYALGDTDFQQHMEQALGRRVSRRRRGRQGNGRGTDTRATLRED